MSLQEEECHAERRDSRYIHVHAYVHLRMYLHADRTVRPKKLASFEPGSSTFVRVSQSIFSVILSLKVNALACQCIRVEVEIVSDR